MGLTLFSALSELKCNSIASMVPLTRFSKKVATSGLTEVCKKRVDYEDTVTDPESFILPL